MTDRSEPGPWTARVLWVLGPFAAGPCLASALDPTLSSFRTTASMGLWLGWLAGLVATLVPRTASLTAVRVILPGGLAATGWATLAMAEGTPTWQPVLAVGWAVLVVASVLSPLLADAFVNGSAYGSERRLALRTPVALLGLAPPAWLVAVVGTCAGPLLLAARLWVPGVAALLVGVPAAVVAVRALHGLARRWVVLVPAGLVLHDPFGLPEAVLFPRRMIANLGPAPAGAAEAEPDRLAVFDATQGAPGLALLLELDEALPMAVRHGRSELASTDADRVLFTPARPGALLAEARSRRIPVG